jgi:hypothetical protein
MGGIRIACLFHPVMKSKLENAIFRQSDRKSPKSPAYGILKE